MKNSYHVPMDKWLKREGIIKGVKRIAKPRRRRSLPGQRFLFVVEIKKRR